MTRAMELKSGYALRRREQLRTRNLWTNLKILSCSRCSRCSQTLSEPCRYTIRTIMRENCWQCVPLSGTENSENSENRNERDSQQEQGLRFLHAFSLY